MFSRLAKLSLAALAAVTFWTETVFAQTYTSMYVFGDSLSDIGQVSKATRGVVPPPLIYYRGRFSNGPIWVDKLAPLLPAPLTLQQDYAFGGAESGFDHSTSPRFPGTLDEITAYLRTNPVIDPNSLYILWAGGNDYLDGQTNSDIPVTNLVNGASSLIAQGAKTLLMPNLPDLGRIPETLNTTRSAPLTALSLEHNAKLQTAIAQLNASYPGVRVILLDTYGLFTDVIANPSAYGFTNVTSACINLPTSCNRNPGNFLFYDTIHPTTKGHQYLSDLAAKTLGLVP